VESKEGKKRMNIYTRVNQSAVFVWPALAFSIEGDFWIELAWLGLAIGLAYES